MSINQILMSGEDIYQLVSEVGALLPDNETHYLAAAGRGTLSAFYDQSVGTTTDLDVFMIYADSILTVLRNAISSVARKHKLGDDWMNDAIANAQWNGRADVPDLDVEELKTFFLNGSEIFFFNDNDYPTLSILPIDEYGIWASKLLAYRDKDQGAMLEILTNRGICDSETLDRLFQSHCKRFTEYWKYEIMIDRARELFNEF